MASPNFTLVGSAVDGMHRALIGHTHKVCHALIRRGVHFYLFYAVRAARVKYSGSG